jgi:HEAT repeat protein
VPLQKLVPFVFVLSWVLSGCRPSSESQGIIERLNSKSIPLRLKAISEAETRRDPFIHDELLRIFNNEQDLRLVRGCAGLALGRLHDGRVVSRIIELLPEAILNRGKPAGAKGLDPFMLGKALAAYGPECLPSLSPLLLDRRKEVVIWVLAQHGQFRHSDAALDVLAKHITNPDPMLRRGAAYGLAQTFHQRAEPLVVRHLNDPDAEVRYHLAWALSNYGSALCLFSLESLSAKETEPQVKQELALAIASVKSRSAGNAVAVGQPRAPSAGKGR